MHESFNVKFSSFFYLETIFDGHPIIFFLYREFGSVSHYHITKRKCCRYVISNTERTVCVVFHTGCIVAAPAFRKHVPS